MYIKPRLRKNFDIVRLADDSLMFKSEHRSVKLEGRDVIGFLNIIIPKLNGTYSLPEIFESLSEYKDSDVKKCYQMLADNNLLEEGNYEQAYESHMPRIRFLNELNVDIEYAEKKISEVSATIFGLGGHGAYLISALANEGIGEIKCIDPTHVSQEDLYLSPIYKIKDINKSREAAIIERVGNDYPRTKFIQSGLDTLDEDAIGRLLNHSNIVISCVDKGFSSINYWINKIALKESISWFSSSLDGIEASVGPFFIPGKTACYMCYTMRLVSNELAYRDSMTYRKYLDTNKKDEWEKRCLLAVNPAILANYLALEVLKNSIGLGYPLAGRLLLINFLNLKSEIHNVLRVPNCPHCGVSRP